MLESPLEEHFQKGLLQDQVLEQNPKELPMNSPLLMMNPLDQISA